MTPTDEQDRLIHHILSHFSRSADLVNYARARHGFGDTDGGFGVAYSTDLDEYDRSLGNANPDGWVEPYGFWGKPEGYELRVTESHYLSVLAAYLAGIGSSRESEEVGLLLKSMRPLA